MLKLFVRVLALMAGLAVSTAAGAVGMGSINVTSALGEPLAAEIELVDITHADKGKLAAHMASPDTFKDAGIDYPSSLPTLSFKVETRENGDTYIKVTSGQALNEPFVSMLVELTWPSGKLLREYTFLLDPPGFKPEQPKPEQVQPVLSKVEAAPKPAEAAKPEVAVAAPVQAAPAVASGVAKASEKPAQPAAAIPAAEKAVQKPESAEKPNTVKVKAGDTLGKIAEEVKSADVSLERMLAALYNANTDAFDGNNMNRIRAGKILHVPDAANINKLGEEDAAKEVSVQTADWNAYRQKLAAASGGKAEQQASSQESAGKIGAAVAEKAPHPEAPKDVVRLSKGEAPGDKAAGNPTAKSLQDKLHAMEEESTAKDKTIKDDQMRIAMLEKNIKDMQHLLELKSQMGAPAKPEMKPAAKPQAAQPEPKSLAAPEVKVEPLPPVSAVKPKPAPKPVAPPPPPPSFLDELLAQPLYLMGGAVVLIALGALGILRAKRGQAEAEAALKELTAQAEAPAEATENGDFTQAVAASAEETDPLKEADLFLNFGRDAQAEEILKDALSKDPGNQDVRLKLLGIYANRKDVAAFSPMALEVRDSGNAAAWEKATELGRGLEPGNPLYGGVESAASAVAQEAAPAALDFDMGAMLAAAPEVPPEASAAAPSAPLDFNLDLGAPAAAEPAPAVEAAPLDFDLGLEAPAAKGAETAHAMQEEATQTALVPDLGGLNFDMSAVTPAAVTDEVAAAESKKSEAEAAMDFMLDIPLEGDAGTEAAEASAAPAPNLDFGGIDLNLDAPPAAPEPAAETHDAHWHDVATKLDLAKAYQEMGDASGAREILEEVLKEGDEQQRAAAEFIMQQLTSTGG